MTPSRFQANSPLDRLRRRRGGMAGANPTPGAARRGLRRSFTEDEERLLKSLVKGEQDFIDSPSFYTKNAERRLFDEAPSVRKPDASWYHPVMDDLNIGRGRMPKPSEQVILTGAEEKVLFLQFNFSRYRISLLQDEVRTSETGKPSHEQCEALLRWYRKADELREQIAETNLALVLAMAKRTRMSEVDFADLVSEGNMALLRAVDKFDCERGFKFSTYACRAILKAFSRQGMKLSKYRQRFPTDFDPKLEKSNYLETRRTEFKSDAAAEVKRLVVENLCELTDIERTVIEHRFRLDSPDAEEKPMTLEQVGQIIGVTKERVRQIQNKALEKIRTELEHQFMGKPRPEVETTEGEGAAPAAPQEALTAQAALN